MNRICRLAAATAATAAATAVSLHVGPAATWLDWPTKELAPRLKGISRKNHIAVTFDDGPDVTSTPKFLDELDRLGWKATFFVLGSMARGAPDVLRRAVDEGHEIGVHGDAHKSHLLMTPVQVRSDMERAVDTVERIAGRSPRWFRPPYGELSIGSILAARRLSLTPVLWSAWGRDWVQGATPDSVTRNVLDRLEPGGTILLHDSDCTSAKESWSVTLGTLPILAERLSGEPYHGVEIGALADHWD